MGHYLNEVQSDGEATKRELEPKEIRSWQSKGYRCISTGQPSLLACPHCGAAVVIDSWSQHEYFHNLQILGF